MYIYIFVYIVDWKASRHSKGHEFKGARCSWSHKFLNITKSFEDFDSVFNSIRMNLICIYISQPPNAPQQKSLQSCWSTFVSNTSPVSFLMQTARLMPRCPPPSNQVGRWGNTNKLGTCACVLKSVLYYTTSQNISNVYISKTHIRLSTLNTLFPHYIMAIDFQSETNISAIRPSCMLCFTTHWPARAHKRPRSKLLNDWSYVMSVTCMMVQPSF